MVDRRKAPIFDALRPVRLRWRGMFVARNQLIVRYELFDEDDEPTVLTAFAPATGQRVGHDATEAKGQSAPGGPHARLPGRPDG
jgi:hypothetical protein